MLIPPHKRNIFATEQTLGGKGEAFFGDFQGFVPVLWAFELIGEISRETE